MAPLGSDRLVVVNLDQDLAFDNGALVALDASPGLLSTPGSSNARPVLKGVAVPNMAGQLLVVDAARIGGCAAQLSSSYALPFALVAGRFENALFAIGLSAPGQSPVGASTRIDLHPFSASEPFGVGLSCGADGVPRAWVGYMVGQDDLGYVSRVDLSVPPGTPDSVVEVNVGKGAPRSFAYDADHDRLYFTGKEVDLAAPMRWIRVGSGCQNADDKGGVQDERTGGCHVDPGFDLSTQFRGAEPNEVALSSAVSPCTSTRAPDGSFTGDCRRAYLSVQMYDADLAIYLGSRPSGDVGGRLVVLELPEGGLGGSEPQVVASADIGVMAGGLHVIARQGKRDLVAVTAIDDALLWLWDDDAGAMVKVIGRNPSGLPVLGHQLTAIAGQELGGGVVRLFVTSYGDDWVSAVDVPVDAPASAAVVQDPLTGYPWRLGVTP
jgi:hypothetical protein